MTQQCLALSQLIEAYGASKSFVDRILTAIYESERQYKISPPLRMSRGQVLAREFLLDSKNREHWNQFQHSLFDDTVQRAINRCNCGVISFYLGQLLDLAQCKAEAWDAMYDTLRAKQIPELPNN